MAARRESFKGKFLVKGSPTSSGRSDPVRRMTDGIFVASYVRLCRIDYRSDPHLRQVGKGLCKIARSDPNFPFEDSCHRVEK